MNWEQEAVAKLPALLSEWLGVPLSDFHVAPEQRDGRHRPDLVIRSPGHRFAVEIKATDGVASLDRGGAQVRADNRPTGGEVPLLVVPYMGPKARAWAHDRRLSWVDLSGNADIWTEGLRVHVAGEPNLYSRTGRPSNPFTPRFSRVSRALLVDANRWWKQAELAADVELPTGTVSKVIQRLLSLDLVVRDDLGRVRSRKPSLLLDAWAQRYSFNDHQVVRYHAVGRTGPAIQKDMAEKLRSVGGRWAATGLSAAWMYTQFADFRINTFYVEDHREVAGALGLRSVERGENVWLVVPRDEGVFYGRVEQGHWCVHPVQAYLDLLGHPERAEEAARSLLRAQWMTWRA